MLEERNISPEWAERCLREPDETEEHDDGTRHFLKEIPEYGNRWLRVIVNVDVKPNKTVTVFFDRKLLRRSYENKG